MKSRVHIHVQPPELRDIKAGRAAAAVLPVALVAVLEFVERTVRLRGAGEFRDRAGPAAAFLAANAVLLRLERGLRQQGREGRSGCSGGSGWCGCWVDAC